MPSSLRTGDATTGRLRLSCTRRRQRFATGEALPVASRGAPPASALRPFRAAPLVLCASGARDYLRSPGDGAARGITSAIKACESGEDVLKLVASSLPDFNSINVSAALSRLAKLPPVGRWKSDDRTHRLVARAGGLLDLMEGQALANTLWACAKLGVTPDWLSRWLVRSLQMVGTMNAHGLSSSIYTLGQLREKPSDAWMAAFYSASLHVLRSSVVANQFVPQALANVLYTLAHLEQKPSAEWMDAYWIAACHSMSTYNPQDLSNTIWASAKLGICPPPVWLAQFWSASLRNLQSSIVVDQFKPQELSNTIWAAATLDISPPASWMELFQIVSRGRLSACNSQDFANMIWAFVKASSPTRQRMAYHLR